ncbi:MAG: hypothetical protein M1837_003661 [Sclerophora amabilis]|nr:MAG: hypothetical protein M1837_003661 [Sclerophora amabilis]
MEVRRTADVLGRLRLSPLCTLLMPTLLNPGQQLEPLSAQVFSVSSPHSFRALSRSRRRGFTTSSSHHQQSSGAKSDPDDSSPKTPPSSDADPSFFNKVALMLESIPTSKPATSSQRTSRFSSPTAQAQNRPSSSANDVLKNFGAHVDREKSRSRSRLPTERMQMPPSVGPDSTSSAPASRFPGPPRPAPLPPLRLGPSIGRSVAVAPERGTDLTRAFTFLNVKCAQNNVRGDQIRQRFHERAGMKRKRLHRERWRKKFMTGFRGMVYKVQAMKRKGW